MRPDLACINAREPRPEVAMDNESSKSYRVEVFQVDNGYVVNVGCKTLIFTCLDDMLNAMELYYTDFQKAKEAYLGK